MTGLVGTVAEVDSLSPEALIKRAMVALAARVVSQVQTGAIRVRVEAAGVLPEVIPIGQVALLVQRKLRVAEAERRAAHGTVAAGRRMMLMRRPVAHPIMSK